MAANMTPQERFLRDLDRAIALVTERLYDLSQAMGADFKKIGWFAPYEDHVPAERHSALKEEAEEVFA